MRWSFALGRIAGIPIRVHLTFLLLLVVFAMWGGGDNGGLGGALEAALQVLLVFACVVLHELGHALAAQRYGIRTHDITLLPIGGIARLERMPEKPTQELVVALAGPAVNVLIALVLGGVLVALHRPVFQNLERSAIPEWLLAINVAMLAFNLIPAFPMDGGRVLRALLALRLPFTRATEIATGVGQAFALVFGTLGYWWTKNPMLVLIAMFVFFMAAEERTSVRTRISLRGVPVRDAMLTEFRVLDARDPLGLAVRHLMAGSQTEFPVIDAGVPVGVLGSATLVAALSRVGPEAAVGSVIGRNGATCDADEPLESALARVRASGRGALPVTSRGALVGLLTLDNVGELLLVRKAIRRFHGDAEA